MSNHKGFTVLSLLFWAVMFGIFVLSYDYFVGDNPAERVQQENMNHWQALMQKAEPYALFRFGEAAQYAIDHSMADDPYVTRAVRMGYQAAMRIGYYSGAIGILHRCGENDVHCPGLPIRWWRKRTAFDRYQEKVHCQEDMTPADLIEACIDGLVRYPMLTQDANRLYDRLMDEDNPQRNVGAAFALARECLLGPEKTGRAAGETIAQMARDYPVGGMSEVHLELKVDWHMMAETSIATYLQQLDTSSFVPFTCTDAIEYLSDENVDPAFVATQVQACAEKLGHAADTWKLRLYDSVNLLDPYELQKQATNDLLLDLRRYEHNDGFNGFFFHSFHKIFRYWYGEQIAPPLPLDMDRVMPAAIESFAGAYVRHVITTSIPCSEDDGSQCMWHIEVTRVLHDQSRAAAWRQAWRAHQTFEGVHALPSISDELVWQAIQEQACVLIPDYVRRDMELCPTVVEWCDPQTDGLDCDGDTLLNQSDSCPTIVDLKYFDQDLDKIRDTCDPCLNDPENNCLAARLLNDYRAPDKYLTYIAGEGYLLTPKDD